MCLYVYIISFILFACNSTNKKYAKGFISYALENYNNEKYIDIPYEFQTGDKVVFHFKNDFLKEGPKERIRGEILKIEDENV